MPDLIATSALGGATAREIRSSRLKIEEIRGRALASIAPFMTGEFTGFTVPDAAEVREDGAFTLFAAGNGVFFVEADAAEHADLVSVMKTRVSGAAITEQTGAWVRVDVTGQMACAMMAKLTMLDLQTQQEMTVSRTLSEHLGLYLMKRSATHLSIYCPSSTARSTWHALEEAAATLVAQSQSAIGAFQS